MGKKRRTKRDDRRGGDGDSSSAVAVADEELLDGDVDGAACERRGVARGTGSADDARAAEVVREARDLLVAQHARVALVRLCVCMCVYKEA